VLIKACVHQNPLVSLNQRLVANQFLCGLKLTEDRAPFVSRGDQFVSLLILKPQRMTKRQRARSWKAPPTRSLERLRHRRLESATGWWHVQDARRD
jgi:hypothetical protein